MYSSIFEGDTVVNTANLKITDRQKSQLRLRSLVKVGATGRAKDLERMCQESNEILSQALQEVDAAKRAEAIPPEVTGVLLQSILDLLAMVALYSDAVLAMRINLDRRFGKTQDPFGAQSRLDSCVLQMKESQAPMMLKGVRETIKMNMKY